MAASGIEPSRPSRGILVLLTHPAPGRRAASVLRTAASSQGLLTPEVDRLLGNLTADYLRDMEATRSAASARLLQLANEMAAGTVTPETLTMKLQRLLQG